MRIVENGSAKMKTAHVIWVKNRVQNEYRVKNWVTYEDWVSMERGVKRWVVAIGDGRYLFYDDVADVDEADEVLEINLPEEMALAFDYLQTSYYNMQQYLAVQWGLMQSRLEEDEEAEEAEEPLDGDDEAFKQQFNAIIRDNKLDGWTGD